MSQPQQEKCRLCLKKLTSENVTRLEERQLSELLIKVFPGINLKLTRCCEICQSCHKTASFCIQFRDFVYFKRRYYKEVRQLKLRKKQCHVCFKDFFRNPKMLCPKLYDAANTHSLKLVKKIVELALSQIKVDQDAIFCKYCWSRAYKIYVFKRNCFETEEMLLKEVTGSTNNKQITKNSTKDVEKYLGDIEILTTPKKLSRYVKNKKNESEDITKNVEIYSKVNGNSQQMSTNNTIRHKITTTSTTKVISNETATEIFDNGQVIETTVLFYEESESDDDIFEEEPQGFDNDIDDVFDEKVELTFKITENEQVIINTKNEIKNDWVIDLAELNELEKRIKEKDNIDINENHLNDEDIDDIFSEEESLSNDNDRKYTEETSTKKEEQELASVRKTIQKLQEQNNVSQQTFSKATFHPPEIPKRQESNNCKVPKPSFSPSNYKLNTNLNRRINHQQEKFDVECHLPAFVAINNKVTEQSLGSYQKTQKTIVGANFQHTENTVQISPHFTKNQDNCELKISNTKKKLELDSYLRTNTILKEDSSRKKSKMDSVVTEDNLSEKLLNKKKEPTKSFCSQMCCMPNSKRNQEYLKTVAEHALIGKLIISKQTNCVKNQTKKKKKPKLPPLIPMLKNTETRSQNIIAYNSIQTNQETEIIEEENKPIIDSDTTKQIHNPTSPITEFNIQNYNNQSTLTENYNLVQVQTSANHYQDSQMSNAYDMRNNNNNLQNNTSYNAPTIIVQAGTQYYGEGTVHTNYGGNMSYYISNGQAKRHCCMNNRCPGNQQFERPIFTIKWSCHMCMAKFTEKIHLLHHLRYHEDPNFFWFSCSKCKFVTTSMPAVQAHLEFCSMEEIVYNKREENQRFVCQICFAEFFEKLSVHTHITNTHARLNQQYIHQRN